MQINMDDSILRRHKYSPLKHTLHSRGSLENRFFLVGGDFLMWVMLIKKIHLQNHPTFVVNNATALLSSLTPPMKWN